MKFRLELIISILAVLSPICFIAVMLFVEPEFFEAIFSGLLAGCVSGSVLGMISLILNKGKSKFRKKGKGNKLYLRPFENSGWSGAG